MHGKYPVICSIAAWCDAISILWIFTLVCVCFLHAKKTMHHNILKHTNKSVSNWMFGIKRDFFLHIWVSFHRILNTRNINHQSVFWKSWIFNAIYNLEIAATAYCMQHMQNYSLERNYIIEIFTGICISKKREHHKHLHLDSSEPKWWKHGENFNIAKRKCSNLLVWLKSSHWDTEVMA